MAGRVFTLPVRVCVCVCVCERERERERETVSRVCNRTRPFPHHHPTPTPNPRHTHPYAQKAGKAVPAGSGLDRNGNPTQEAQRILDGGVLLPFGGYKVPNFLPCK